MIKKGIIKEIPIFGPYSTYVLINNILFISGQIGIDFKSGKLISNSIEMETKRIMNNIKIILLKNNMDFKNIVKTTIFVKKMDHINIINNIYSNFFINKKFPAREAIQVSCLPKNANIEISAIAAI
ncbi:Rid family detoxifying hydrolase [Blattabacterium cuenoti]|uniref:Rid family detoxifying hydrolase n=1 Tax=Blattabacterium cuenoti TaxID=1653831 RepID=UPI00163CB2A4|nr:Rid family detoxifying hydrolase [Blattabacterium cuenoti]